MTTSELTVIVSDEVEEDEESGESGLSDSGSKEFVLDEDWYFVELLFIDFKVSVKQFSFSSSSMIFKSFSDFTLTKCGLVVSVDSAELNPSSC